MKDQKAIESQKTLDDKKTKGGLVQILIASFVALAVFAVAFKPVQSMYNDYKAESALGTLYSAHQAAAQNLEKVQYSCTDYTTENITSRLPESFYYDEDSDVIRMPYNDMYATSGCDTMPTSSSGTGTSDVDKAYLEIENVSDTVCQNFVTSYVNDSRALTVTSDSSLTAIKHSAETTAGSIASVGATACISDDNTNTIQIWEK